MSPGVAAKVLFEYIAQQDDELTIRMGEVITNVQQEDGGWWKGEVNGRCGMFPENFVSIVKSPSALNPTTFKAEVKFDYEPVQSDEIALLKGVIIDVIDTPDEGWWKGRCDGREGLFPSNFVVVVEPGKPSEPAAKPVPFPAAEHAKQAESDIKVPQPPKGPSKIANLLGMIKPEDLCRTNLKKINTGTEMKPAEYAAADASINENDGVLKPTQLVPPMHVDGEKEKKKVPLIPGATGMTETKPLQCAIALYDYEPELPDELELKVGDKITVIDTELTFEGWMRGEVNGQVGIFPDNFVELIHMEAAEKPLLGEPIKEEPLIPKPTREEPVPKPAVKEEPASRPKQGIPMLPPGGKPLQDELAQKLSRVKMSPPNIALNSPPKIANKTPPPIPAGKPAIPGTKPKPQIQFSKPPMKPPNMLKPDNKQAVPFPDTKQSKDDVKPHSPKAEPRIHANILKPVTPKNEYKSPGGNKSDSPVVQNNDVRKNIANVRIPSLEEMDTNKTKNVKGDNVPPLPKCPSVSSIEKPPQLGEQRRSRTVSGNEAEAMFNKYSNPSFDKNIKDKNGMDDVAEDHKVTGDDLRLDDVKPTDPLKHVSRVKPPAKSPPSKYKDKHPFDLIDPVVNPVDNSKEVNELKSQVTELQNKMEDMEEMFKKLVIQLTDDISTERKLRSNQQIEIETLNRKLNIFLNKPNS